MINPLYSLQSFANFIQLPNAGRTFVKPLFNNDAWSKILFLTKQSTLCAHLIRWLFGSFIKNSFLFFFCPLFSLRFSRELLLIKILTRDSYIVYIVGAGGVVDAGFNKTPAATAHIGRQLRDSKLCLTISLHYLSKFTQENLISAGLDDSNLFGTSSWH